MQFWPLLQFFVRSSSWADCDSYKFKPRVGLLLREISGLMNPLDFGSFEFVANARHTSESVTRIVVDVLRSRFPDEFLAVFPFDQLNSTHFDDRPRLGGQVLIVVWHTSFCVNYRLFSSNASSTRPAVRCSISHLPSSAVLGDCPTFLYGLLVSDIRLLC